jgi:hypothetical protein
MSEEGQDQSKKLIVSGDRQVIPDRQINEALEHMSHHQVTDFALRSATGEMRLAAIVPPGLTAEIYRRESAVIRYALFSLMTASLYWETKDGYLSLTKSRDFADQIQTIVKDPRDDYKEYFRNLANQQDKTKKIPSDLNILLADSHQMLTKYEEIFNPAVPLHRLPEKTQ